MFAKGNTLWKESHISRKKNYDRIDQFLLILANQGSDKYAEFMDTLARDGELSKNQIEYMNRLEGWREYVKPKLAKIEGDQKMDHTITFKWDGDNNTVQTKGIPKGSK